MATVKSKAKTKSSYVCQSCGAAYPKWIGRCEACGEWNTLVEERIEAGPAKSLGLSEARRSGRKIELVDLRGQATPLPRRQSGIAELDRVTGGGLVPGSVLLIGGDPGIGKSTLMLQAACRLGEECDVIYISGEEAVDQLRLRARRLELEDGRVKLAAATSIRDILASIEGANAPDILIIDSIQTMYLDLLDSAPGSVAQVRASAHALITAAKQSHTVLLLIGHVTKDGQIAGPRVLEHMVDAVLYFEGDRGHQFRILRAVKNRFGATDEIGVFEMGDRGLQEVQNPSALFLEDQLDHGAGSAVFAGIEGTRPVLVEVQALVGPPAYGTPRRAVVGWDSGRLAMILAVLEVRGGLKIGAHDVYLNIAGGLKLSEPAADLAVAAALVSAMTGVPLPEKTIVFGEIGLGGELRQVSQMQARLKEAQKLGFQRAYMPKSRKSGQSFENAGLEIGAFAHLTDLISLFATQSV